MNVKHRVKRRIKLFSVYKKVNMEVNLWYMKLSFTVF